MSDSTPTLPPELIALAEEFGIGADEIEAVHQIIQLTPNLPAKGIAVNGQSVGDGTVRVAREYDAQATEEEKGFSLLVVEAPEGGVQVAMLVDRAALAAALTVEIPDIPKVV